MPLDVCPGGTFEVCVAAQDPTVGVDIFDTLDDANIKVTVEDWRISDTKDLETHQTLNYMAEEVGSGHIDASSCSADDDKDLVEPSLLHHLKSAVSKHLCGVFHDIESIWP